MRGTRWVSLEFWVIKKIALLMQLQEVFFKLLTNKMAAL